MAADPADRAPAESPPAARIRAAAVRVRFDNGRPEFGQQAPTDDRLRAVAVFADVDRRDSALADALVGQPPADAPDLQPDTCALQALAGQDVAALPALRPQSWAQLLDVGNLELRAGQQRLPLRIQLLPAIIDATRGVRYEGAAEHGRGILSAGQLQLAATGGDGVAAFSVAVRVPRPVRITFVGEQPPQAGIVRGVAANSEIRLRWGSVDGAAELELIVGMQSAAEPGWLRCRLRDDGEFAVPAELAAKLPARSEQRPWVLMLVRRARAAIGGFAGSALVIELADAVHLLQ